MSGLEFGLGAAITAPTSYFLAARTGPCAPRLALIAWLNQFISIKPLFGGHAPNIRTPAQTPFAFAANRASQVTKSHPRSIASAR